MVMMAAPLEAAVSAAQQARAAQGLGPAPVALLAPVGRRYDQAGAEAMAASDGLILICGRYEGVDQRFIERCVTQEISLGDFVLSGGEIAALAVIDAAVPAARRATMATRPCRTRSTIRCPACWTVRITRARKSMRGAAVPAAAQRSPCADRRLAASARLN